MSFNSVEDMSLKESLEDKIIHLLDNLPFANDDLKVSMFVDSLLECSAYVYLSSIDKDFKKVSDKLVQQLCSVIFNHKTKPYQAFLTCNDDPDISEDYNKDVMNFLKELQNLIQKQDNLYENIPGKEAGSELMKRIMCEVFNQNRLNLEPLKILALLGAISGLDIPLLFTSDTCCNGLFKGLSINIVALNGLLEACSCYPQYFSTTSAPQEHIKPVDWLEGIMAALLDLKGTNNKTWLKCFRSLLKISLPVVENNITSIIKTCLFNCVVTTDTKLEYCGLFNDLLSLHSRLYQLPKFVVKLLRSMAECIKENSVGECLVKGQLFPSILDSMAAQFQGMHFGQTIEMWEIFSETYTTFGNMCEVFDIGKGVVFILAQIFSTFLMHSKIFEPSLPSDIREKYGELIQHTTDELKKNVSVLSSENQVLRQQAFLLLCNVVGKVKLSYSYHDEKPAFCNSTWILPENLFDFSLLFNFFTEKHAEKMKLFLNGEDKTLSLLVFQMLILKVQGLMHMKELSEVELHQFKITVSAIVDHAEDHILMGASWDLDLTTLSNDNYGSAVWRILLEFLPLIMDKMNDKELLKICSSLREIVLHEKKFPNSGNIDGTVLTAIVLSSLQSTHFQQSKFFQRTLTSSIWKLDSVLLARKRLSIEIEHEGTLIKVLTNLSTVKRKWLKYAESTPKKEESDELNPLWSGVEETCCYLNQVLLAKSVARAKIQVKVFNILQLIDCIPLRYLMPGNQVRCVVGLSTLFFLVPESCHSDNALKTAVKIAEQLIAIFNGERSVWLFDFVTSGPYLKEIINTIEKVTVHHTEIPDSLKVLLENLISLITKNSKILSDAEDYFLELLNEENFSPVSILMLNITLQKLAQMLHKKELKPEYAEACKKLASSVSSCCVKALKRCDTKCSNSTFTALIQCYTEVIEILSLSSCVIGEKKRDKYLSQLPKIIEFSKQAILDQQTINSSESSLDKVVLIFFARICKHHQHITSFVPEGLYSEIWHSIYTSLQQSCSTNKTVLDVAHCMQVNSLKEHETELLQCLFPLLSSQEFNNTFNDLSSQVKNWNIVDGNAQTLQMNLNIIKEMIESDSQKTESDLPKQSVVDFLLHIIYRINQADQSTLYLNTVKLPVFNFINFLIKQKKNCISDDQWLDCLYPCVAMDLIHMSNNLPMFVKTWDVVWNCIYNLLVFHSGFVLKAISVFMVIVTNLLKSLVLAGSQDAVHESTKDIQDKMLLCAQNMDRLLTMITKHQTQFAKLVPFLIGDYADSVQHVTLEANIKSNLIAGLNRLLSLCSENCLKMVAVNINHSCREIFSNIVKDYNHSRHRGYI